MAAGQAFTCDECPARKQKTNHWWLMYRRPGSAHFELAAWDDDEALKPGVGHLCGAECAQKALARYLGAH